MSLASAELSLMTALYLDGQRGVVDRYNPRVLQLVEWSGDGSLTLLPLNLLHDSISVLVCAGAREQAGELYGLAERVVQILEDQAYGIGRQYTMDEAWQVLCNLSEAYGF